MVQQVVNVAAQFHAVPLSERIEDLLYGQIPTPIGWCT
jgi:hypothetical protein